MRLCWVGLLAAAAAELVTLTSEESFEQRVMQDSELWAVLFTSRTRDDDPNSEAMLQAFHGLAAGLGHRMSWGRADVDDVKAFASEFNIRKRMVPRAVLFSSRARMADVLRLDEISEDALEAAVREVLGSVAEETADGQRWKKHTLAIGASGDKDEV
jgi:thioredoxin-like negative regulator of GroEL